MAKASSTSSSVTLSGGSNLKVSGPAGTVIKPLEINDLTTFKAQVSRSPVGMSFASRAIPISSPSPRTSVTTGNSHDATAVRIR